MQENIIEIFKKLMRKPVISTIPESSKFGGDLNDRIKKMEQMRKQNNFQQSPLKCK